MIHFFNYAIRWRFLSSLDTSSRVELTGLYGTCLLCLCTTKYLPADMIIFDCVQCFSWRFSLLTSITPSLLYHDRASIDFIRSTLDILTEIQAKKDNGMIRLLNGKPRWPIMLIDYPQYARTHRVHEAATQVTLKVGGISEQTFRSN